MISNNQIIEKETSFHDQTKIKEVYETTDLEELIKISKEKLMELSENFVELGSGWIFKLTNYLIIKIDEFIPISGGSYKILPKRIKSKKAINRSY